MMDEKKVREAIEDFKKLAELLQNKESAAVEHCNIAIEALEKQLPKRVENRTEYKNLYGHLIFYKGFCPNCGFVVDSSKNNHCNACGQKLDWTVEE